MRIFKNKWFARFARKNRISDDALKAAAAEIDAGNCDADLGGHVFKQRVARDGQGKRGGYRTIVLFKRGARAFFVYGFAKNELDNITNDDLVGFKETAEDFMKLHDDRIRMRLEDGSLIEITPEA